MLPVNEIFHSIQGEATFTGTPSVFVRLQGCPVGCGWCDTKHTWEIDKGKVIPIARMVEKEADSDCYAELGLHSLISEIQKFDCSHVVITGGEPCIHDLRSITGMLIGEGFTVQIETSGTHPILCHPDTWVTVSPKVGMPGGLVVREDALARADEIKHPVGKPSDIEALSVLLELVDDWPVIWLQPLSQSKKATTLCFEEASKRSWRVSIQTHKFLGLR